MPPIVTSVHMAAVHWIGDANDDDDDDDDDNNATGMKSSHSRPTFTLPATLPITRHLAKKNAYATILGGTYPFH